MGCTISETSNPFNPHFFRIQPPPQQERPRLLSNKKIPEETKQILWNYIETNDVKRLAFTIQHQQIDLRSQIVHDGSYWTMLHFACRWNADLCVAFLLRRLYQYDPLDYVQSVNMQTVQGYTPLELTAIWGAEQSFIQLVQAGGIDLSLKNTKGIDIFIEARTYRRQKMLKQLQEFKNNGVLLIQVNVDELKKSLKNQDILMKTKYQINEIKEKRRRRGLSQDQRRHKNKDHYKINLQGFTQLEQNLKKLIQDQREYQRQNARIMLQLAEKQKKLDIEQEQKQRKRKEQEIKQQQNKGQSNINPLQMVAESIIQSFDDLSNKMSKEKQLLQQQRRLHEESIKKQQQQFIFKQQQIQFQNQKRIQKLIQEQRLEEEKRLKQQIKKAEEQKKANQQKKKEEQKRKERQLQQLRVKQKAEQLQKRKKQQQQQIKKKQEEEKEKKRILDQKKKRYQQELEAQKIAAAMLDNLAQQPTLSEIKDSKSSGTLPPEFKQLYASISAKGSNFVDKDFPPQKSTLGTPPKPSKTIDSSVWLRPFQIFGSSYQVFDGIDPEDIKQGSLGVCYYLATLSSLAEKADRIRRMFTFYDKDLGFYIVTLYINGAPKNIVVDDYFPCSKGTKQPLFTKPNGKQIWVMILQKAWVKNFGNYFSAQGMAAQTMMEDVAGAPSKGGKIQNTSSELAFLANCQKNNYIIVLSSMSKNAPKGIVAGHAYSLIDVYHEEQPQLLKIRNPWGSFQWSGQYGDKSNNWNSALKQRLNVKDSQDGIFFMTPNQLPIGFTYYSVSMVKQNAKYLFLDFKSKPLQQKFWSFRVNKRGSVNIRVTQLFDRLIKDSQYKYSPLIFQCGWIKSPNEVVFMGQGSHNSIFGDKSVHFHDDLFLDLQPGDYFIRVKVFWKLPKYNEARIISYSDLDINLVERKPQEMKTYWIQMITYFLSSCTKSPMLSGNISLIQKWMKGQYIMGITNNNKKATYVITISLAQKDFFKCTLSYGKSAANQIKVVVGPQQTKVAAVIDKTQLNSASTIGKFTVSALTK